MTGQQRRRDHGPPGAKTFVDAVVAVIRALQTGEVVSYGEVARRAGYPRRARGVGHILSTDTSRDLPWWRVVRADGRLVAPEPRRQQTLLEAEGVDVEHGRVIGGVP